MIVSNDRGGRRRHRNRHEQTEEHGCENRTVQG